MGEFPLVSGPQGIRRRLATILAIDVAGFSRLAETDEAHAVEALSKLRLVIGEAAERFEGRIFHSAGDGFMLEFATVTGALEAADTIRSVAQLPVRLGVHVGEISLTPEDDLLGHGVNVAARLQAKAPIGGVLVSEDVARAERGDLSRKLSPAGRIKLDKMRETLPVYLLEARSGKRNALRQNAVFRALGFAAGDGVILIAAVWLGVRIVQHGGWTAPPPPKPTPISVSVQPLDILGASDPALSKFAGELQAELIDRLAQDQINILDPGQTASAPYGFGGSVERTGDDVVAHLRFSDQFRHATVWSEAFKGPLASEGLQQEITNLASHVASDANQFSAKAKGDPVTLSQLIQADIFSIHNRDQDREAEWLNARALLHRLPDDADAHARFALVSAFMIAVSGPDRAAEMRKVVEQETAFAQRLDPTNDGLYFARLLAVPLVGNWRKREAILADGLKANPTSGLLRNHQSNLLREVGRLQDALRWARQAAAPAPPSPSRTSTLLLALAATGQYAEAGSVAETVTKTWPRNGAAWNARLQNLIFQGRWDAAYALFQPDVMPVATMNDNERQAWLLALRALRLGNPGARQAAAKALVALPQPSLFISQQPHETYSAADRIGLIAALGDLDDAFRLAGDYLRKDGYADSSFLFWPDLAQFRRDPRFASLVNRIGMIDYWRSTRTSPDFCADKNAPAICAGLNR